MSFIRMKNLNGKTQHYLEKSVRLMNGKVRKFSLYLKDYSPKKKHYPLKGYNEMLEQKITKGIADFAAQHYETNHIFTEDVLRRLEEIRLGYKKIIRTLTKNQLQDVLDRFTVNFTYESNAIEGNSLTLKDVTFIIREGRVLEGRSLREVYETINTRTAVEWLFERKPKLTEANIIRLHYLLVKETGIRTGYKQFPNFLIGRQLETTPPELVKEEMSELLSWCKQNERLHPLQLATMFHGRFERIHPFEDGNGRAGRLIVNMILLNKGYPPLIIRKSQKIAYFHALEAFDNGHHDTLYRFLLQKYKDTYEKFFKVYVRYLPK